MKCKECGHDMKWSKKLLYIDDYWYYLRIYYCPNHGNFYSVRDLQAQYRITPDTTQCIYVRYGMHVAIQGDTGKLMEGYVQDILSTAATDPLGVRVRLINGTIGRIQQFIP